MNSLFPYPLAYPVQQPVEIKWKFPGYFFICFHLLHVPIWLHEYAVKISPVNEAVKKNGDWQ